MELDDLQKLGYILVCSGCKALEQGGPRTGHSDSCGTRISQFLSSVPEGQSRLYEAKRGEDSYLADQVKKSAED